MITFTHRLLIVTVLLILFCPPTTGRAASPSIPDYSLALSFNFNENELNATAKIEIPADRQLTLDLTGLTPTGTLLKDADGGEKQLWIEGDSISLKASLQPRTLYLSYTKRVKDRSDNILGPQGITLLDKWYPYPSIACLFNLSAEMPEGFSAITQSDVFPLARSGNTATGHWSRPTRDISFIAGPYIVEKRKVREQLYVYSMFFKEDSHLAGDYLEAAGAYIQRYEKEIGPFPFNHYVITANRLPSGYGMPTFTLLGQMVLRLPFIIDTSLGHEIVHSWFGNDIQVDYSGGNWCEGLTSFLADHRYAAEGGNGVLDRKTSLGKYHSYRSSDEKKNIFSLGQFTSASHSQQMAEYKRSVGYNGGAFFFHELRLYLGSDIFQSSLQKFYADHRGTAASWDHLRKSFEDVSGKDLSSFFATRLEMTKPPTISIKNIATKTGDGIRLNFTLCQDAVPPIPLTVPLEIVTTTSTTRVLETLDTSEKNVTIELNETPLKIIIDPKYDLLRTLSPSELVPVWSRFLGAEKKLVILADESSRSRYQPFLDALSRYEFQLAAAEEATNRQLAENSILFLGADQVPCRSIFGRVVHPQGKTSIDVRNNPLNPEHVAVIISADDIQHNISIARRLSHYGKYSYLEFVNGRPATKEIHPSVNGIVYTLESLPEGGAVRNLSTFQATMDEISKKRVIYVGETHTAYEDHLLQLRIIEALYKRHPQLAIGMEMFPSSAQKSLDAYTISAPTMDEIDFLKQSDYFNVWRFDYRLYRDILQFARENQLRVIGLNLNRDIVSEVYRTGTTDTLDETTQQQLVQDRNLDMKGYRERIFAVHGAHVSGSHGSGFASGFIQAQALWDETMALHISEYLRENPEHKLVVIAGSQHTRKDSGIPPRVAQRINVKQASVLNIAGDPPENLAEIADYFFLAPQAELPDVPKIGIVLKSKENCKTTEHCLVIDEISPHGKAGQAGLQKGDVLYTIDNTEISDMTDLRIALIDRTEGETVEIEVARPGDEHKHHSFSVELTLPQKSTMKPPGHP